jgi:hypothetical protein
MCDSRVMIIALALNWECCCRWLPLPLHYVLGLVQESAALTAGTLWSWNQATNICSALLSALPLQPAHA